jgi:hypothetical protein
MITILDSLDTVSGRKSTTKRYHQSDPEHLIIALYLLRGLDGEPDPPIDIPPPGKPSKPWEDLSGSIDFIEPKPYNPPSKPTGPMPGKPWIDAFGKGDSKPPPDKPQPPANPPRDPPVPGVS